MGEAESILANRLSLKVGKSAERVRRRWAAV